MESNKRGKGGLLLRHGDTLSTLLDLQPSAVVCLCCLSASFLRLLRLLLINSHLLGDL